jgi:hypothetical protein
MTRPARILVLLVAFTAPLAGQAPAPSSDPPPAPLWNIADFEAPESAYYDPESNALFVSSINGDMTAKDGNGYISRLTPDGTVVNRRWVTGLNGPKGMRSVNGTLWVADIDEVVGIEIWSGRITSRVAVEGAVFLNDLATAPDGTVYVSDSQGFRIYAVSGGRSSVFVEGIDVVETPNGVLVDNGRLLVGSLGAGAFGPPPGDGAGRGPRGRGVGRGAGAGAPPGAGRGGGAARGGPPGGRGPGRGAAPAGGRLFAFDLTTKVRTVITPEPFAGIDGIEPDGRGNYLVTDVFGSRIVHVSPDGATRTVLQLPAAGADFSYIGPRQMAVVPYLFGNTVSAYGLSGLLP